MREVNQETGEDLNPNAAKSSTGAHEKSLEVDGGNSGINDGDANDEFGGRNPDRPFEASASHNDLSGPGGIDDSLDFGPKR